MRYASTRPDESGGSILNRMALIIVMGAAVLFIGMHMGFVSGTIAFGKQQPEKSIERPITPSAPSEQSPWAAVEY